jgi:ABC-type dipeptide/oligopeptide/nickel transport system permease component
MPKQSIQARVNRVNALHRPTRGRQIHKDYFVLKFLLARFGHLLFVLVGVSFLTFLVGHLAPGDPVLTMMGFNHNHKLYLEIAKAYGLDKPLISQYLDYMAGIVHGDFGLSYIQRGQHVTDILATYIPVSLEVGGLALLSTLAVGVPLGVAAAIRHDTWLDNTIMGGVLTFYAIPNFVLAPLFLALDIFLYQQHLPSLPVAGWGTPAHLVLPVLIYTLGGAAYVARLTRNSVLEVQNEDYVRTARAKGVPILAVRVRHILRNALIPIVTYVGPALAFLVSGSFVIEYLFALPGIGFLAVQSLYQRDYPVVIGITLVLACAVVVMNFLTDLAYSLLDPRVRY